MSGRLPDRVDYPLADPVDESLSRQPLPDEPPEPDDVALFAGRKVAS